MSKIIVDRDKLSEVKIGDIGGFILTKSEPDNFPGDEEFIMRVILGKVIAISKSRKSYTIEDNNGEIWTRPAREFVFYKHGIK